MPNPELAYTYRRIDEKDLRLLFDREVDSSLSSSFYAGRSIFGAAEVNNIDMRISMRSHNAEPLFPRDRDYISSQLRQVRGKLTTLLTRNPKGVVNLYAEGGLIDDDNRLAYDVWPKDLDVQSQVLIPPEAISDKQLVDTLRIHINNHETKQQTLEARLPSLRRSFIQGYVSLQRSGVIPADTPTPQQRMAITNVVLADELITALDEVFGDFSANVGRIRISESAINSAYASVHAILYGRFGGRESLLKEVFYHEMLHAMSGRTIVAKTEKRSDQDQRYTDEELEVEELNVEHETQRVGLHIEGRFNWLNEAVTEELTEKLSKTQSPMYKDRRILYNLLRTKGAFPIPEEAFIEAYFENFDISLAPGQRVPQWRSLHKAISSAYSPGFLVRLDTLVQKNSLDEAISLMEQDPSLI